MTSECSKIREFSKVVEDITTLKANVREDKHESGVAPLVALHVCT
jgi:hypothetical protein